ncbi:hypothetical protein BMS3Bbin10_00149 [bacterium BMS3Bbin10]|nr:hypothetical protein BMS3Bbin10_00149 [bacterium BMS3Bbin10]
MVILSRNGNRQPTARVNPAAEKSDPEIDEFPRRSGIRATSGHTEPFDGVQSAHSARRGAQRNLVGWASDATPRMGGFGPPPVPEARLRHDRPVFRARRTALRSACGRPDHGANRALPANAKNRSNDSVWPEVALASIGSEIRCNGAKTSFRVQSFPTPGRFNEGPRMPVRQQRLEHHGVQTVPAAL